MSRINILSIDQGTTGTTAILWDETGTARAKVNREHRQYYPQPGWVEHDPAEIWQATLAAIQELMREASISPKELTVIGITNQRETMVVLG